MANPAIIEFDITETVYHRGRVHIDQDHLKEWMDDLEYTELTPDILREYIADTNLNVEEHSTDVQGQDWDNFAVDGKPVTLTDNQLAQTKAAH